VAGVLILYLPLSTAALTVAAVAVNIVNIIIKKVKIAFGET
jgi:hypothetical protein